MKYKVFKKPCATIDEFEKKLQSKLEKFDFVYDEESKFVIVLGGDGTLLRAIHNDVLSECTYYIINFGTLGHYSTIENVDVDIIVDNIVNKKYVVDKYHLGELLYNGNKRYFVNEVIFSSHRFIKNGTIKYGDSEHSVNASKFVVSSKFGSSGFVNYNSNVEVDFDIDFFQIGCIGSVNNKILSSLKKDVIVSDKKIVFGTLENVDYINIDYDFFQYNDIIEYVIKKSETTFFICR